MSFVIMEMTRPPDLILEGGSARSIVLVRGIKGGNRPNLSEQLSGEGRHEVSSAG